MNIFKKRVGKNCLICKFQTSFFAKNGNNIIFKCNSCGFGYTDGNFSKLQDYHRDDSYIKEEELFKNIFARRVKEISKYIKTGKVLEIGCSTGLMLSLFKNIGFEVEGIEASKKAAEYARKKGLEVKIAFFEKVNFTQKYNLIILNHTLEHMEDPIGVLIKIKKILKPKGYLMIDLPNFDSPVAKILKGKWPHLLADEHLWHFTPKAFSLLFKKIDFKILKINRTSGIWDFKNPYKEVFKSLIGFKKRFANNVITLAPSWVMTKLNKGSDLLLIARKK